VVEWLVFCVSDAPFEGERRREGTIGSVQRVRCAIAAVAAVDAGRRRLPSLSRSHLLLLVQDELELRELGDRSLDVGLYGGRRMIRGMGSDG
jgi:hypothetical protein